MLLKELTYTSVSTMVSLRNPKYYGVLISPAGNGRKYDNAIDAAIVDEISRTRGGSGSFSSYGLKQAIQGTLNRRIFPKTYYNHLKMLVSDNLLNRDDSAGIGNQVFYSLTEEAKKRKQLRLLRTDSDYRLIKRVYCHLLFQGIIKNGGNKISIQNIMKGLPNYSQIMRVAMRLLVDSGLLEFDQKRYLLADPALHNLLKDMVDFRKAIQQNDGKNEKRQINEEYEMMETNNKTNSRIIAINEIKKKNANTLKEYSFLSDVIQIFCPPLFPDLPYRELTSL